MPLILFAFICIFEPAITINENDANNGGTFASSYLSKRSITLSYDGATWFIQMNQGKRVKLIETAPNQYQIEGYPIDIRFSPNSQGAIDSFILIQNQQEIQFHPVEKLKAEYQAIAQKIRPNGLADAVLMNDLAAAQVLIEKGADVMELDTRRSIAGPNGRRPLNWAALDNNVAMIELLLNAGADINATNRSGYTPLHHAAEGGSLEAAQLLIKRGADKSLVNKNKQTAAEVAARLDHRELIPVLVIN